MPSTDLDLAPTASTPLPNHSIDSPATPRALTPKAIRTRERIVAAALRLFTARGYQATTLREIAAEAGVSLGLTYRYFGAKEELVVAMYERCATEFLRWIDADLPAGTLGKRFGAAMRADLAQLAPFRDDFGALFQVGLTPGSEVAVLGDKASGVRDMVWGGLLRVVEGSRDAPRPRQAREIATALYAAHLMMILFWLQDRTPGQQKTEELIAFAEDLLARLRLALALPGTARALTRLVSIIEPVFGGGPAA